MQTIKDPADWCGRDIASGKGWMYRLTDAEVTDLQAMAQAVVQRIEGDANRLLDLTKQDFELQSFAPRLRQIYEGLKSDLGLALIKGLPVDEMPSIEVATIYWGIGCHLGAARPNNPEGDMLGLITDLGKTQSDAKSRGYQTREAMDYHCDQCDIVGLLCMRTAKSGGVSKVASSVTMYNEMVTRHPDLAACLAAPFYWTKHGEHGAEEKPYYTSSVFNFSDGRLSTSFGPKHIFKGHDLPEVPDLSPQQKRAIEVAEDIANENRLEMVLECGDMQFLNNYVTLHTRSAFVDYPEPSQKRLLWRLWLMNDDLRARTGYSRQWSDGVALGQATARIAV